MFHHFDLNDNDGLRMEYYFDLHGLEVQTSNGVSQEFPKWIINEIVHK